MSIYHDRSLGQDELTGNHYYFCLFTYESHLKPEKSHQF